MKVAFDAVCLGDGPITGVARAFLTGLAAYLPLARGPVVVLLPHGSRLPPDPAFDQLDVVHVPHGALLRQLLLPRTLHRLGASVLHSSVAAVPLLARCATIATVHDLPWLHPESGETTSWRRRFATTRSLHKAAAVLAPSRHTLADARRLAPSHRRLLHVPHGTAAAERPPIDPRQRLGPLLVLGDDRPRKNRARVSAAHELAQQRCPDLPHVCFLGPPGNYGSERDKQALLAGARMVVQCSLFEGFGLPVLEGLAHGAPVLCSDIAPFREIAGDDALFVDARDPAAIADAMVRLHTDDALRARLAAAGPRRAAAFSPAAVAAAWLRLHEELAS